jgi:hemerythrin-like domain-containing protein
MTKLQSPLGRRDWLVKFGAAGAGLVLGSNPLLAAQQKAQTKPSAKKKEEEEEDVSPAEDLMREHGVLKRVLMIYREVMGRIDRKQDFPPDVVADSAKLIRKFVEDYHEKLEEDYLFPRFRKANKLVDLVTTLNTQHQKGRILTDQTLQLATVAAIKDAAQKQKLRTTLEMFVRMYEPHEAREDTVLFPAFRKLVSEHEYDALGEDFEKKENLLFGGEGFEKNVDAVAALEKKLGIYELAQFTPNV